MAASLAEENLLVTNDFNRQVSTCFCSAHASHMTLLCLVVRQSGFAAAYAHSFAVSGMQYVLTDGWKVFILPLVLNGWVGGYIAACSPCAVCSAARLVAGVCYCAPV